uniref:Uncharacterized protein n=1 Tax=Setaria digitata TaxID=48799 RepID=A0A915PIC8_9BILA
MYNVDLNEKKMNSEEMLVDIYKYQQPTGLKLWITMNMGALLCDAVQTLKKKEGKVPLNVCLVGTEMTTPLFNPVFEQFTEDGTELLSAGKMVEWTDPINLDPDDSTGIHRKDKP